MRSRRDSEYKWQQLIQLVELQLVKIDSEIIGLNARINEQKKLLELLRMRIRRNDLPLLLIEKNKKSFIELEKKVIFQLEELSSLYSRKKRFRDTEHARREVLRKMAKL